MRLDAGSGLTGEALRTAAAGALVGISSIAPRGTRSWPSAISSTDALPRLLAEDLSFFHAYAFATVRMAGAAFELLGDHARWLFGDDAAGEASDAATELVDGCKAMLFRLARRRPFEPSDRVAALAAAWERLIAALLAGETGSG